MMLRKPKKFQNFINYIYGNSAVMHRFVFKSVIALCLLSILGCSTTHEHPIEKALASKRPEIARVMDSIEKYEVQILYSEVLRDSDSKVWFKDYGFQVNDSNYFYPASSVKFPIAVLALEYIDKHSNLQPETSYKIENDSIQHNVMDDVIKIFAVSDNDAYNRLYELLGRDYINKRLHELGLKGRISHRLSTKNADKDRTLQITFFPKLNDSIIIVPKVDTPVKHLQLKKIKKGVGYLENDSLVGAPMDFSEKNYLPVTTLHTLMKRVIFPKEFESKKRFQLKERTRQELLHAMKILPNNAGYNRTTYYDSYVKFLLFGDSTSPIPEHIEIYNKVGYAYGYLTDCAYIKNTKTNTEHIITATIHVNTNGIFNDDTYEYESVGIPFLAELGRALTGTQH